MTLTCNAPNVNSSGITWRASTPGTTQPEIIATGEMIRISSYSSNDNAGAYYCLAGNELGVFVSEPVVLVSDNNVSQQADGECVCVCH